MVRASRLRGTLVVRWVECWTADSENPSSVGSNPSGGSLDRWCQKVPALTGNWLYSTIPAYNFWVGEYPGESQGGTARVAVSHLREGSHELASYMSGCVRVQGGQGGHSEIKRGELCGTLRVRLCLPRCRSTLVARCVECWTTDSENPQWRLTRHHHLVPLSRTPPNSSSSSSR